MTGDGDVDRRSRPFFRADLERAVHLVYQFAADGQSQSLGVVGARLGGVLHTGQFGLGYTLARVVDDYHQSAADVVVTGAHHTAEGVLGSVSGDLCYGVTQVLGVDVDDKLLVGALHNVAGGGVTVPVPSLHALRLEGLSEVVGLAAELHHVGLETRQIENVVDEMQQVVGVAQDASAW